MYLLFVFSYMYLYYVLKKLKTSVEWVRERTLPTERPPLVGDVSANFWG
jgi:hypothetical protein